MSIYCSAKSLNPLHMISGRAIIQAGVQSIEAKCNVGLYNQYAPSNGKPVEYASGSLYLPSC